VNHPIKVFIVDDEAPARARLRGLLDDCRRSLPNVLLGEAGSSQDALQAPALHEADVVLLDIDMPGGNGLHCARELARRDKPPTIIFVTAHNEHALAAFDLGAVDYLLKPVRLMRLEAALKRVLHPGVAHEAGPGLAENLPDRHLMVNDKGRVLRVPIEDVLYLRAELKYVSLRTRAREYVLTESLNQLEQEFSPALIRIHRNCLVSRRHLVGFELGHDDDGDRWYAVLQNWPERLPVSRRQTHVVKAFREG
jgi:two-component system response regulator AlgR